MSRTGATAAVGIIHAAIFPICCTIHGGATPSARPVMGADSTRPAKAAGLRRAACSRMPPPRDSP